jgi:hypothetical protein
VKWMHKCIVNTWKQVLYFKHHRVSQGRLDCARDTNYNKDSQN